MKPAGAGVASENLRIRDYHFFKSGKINVPKQDFVV
jgi:hypothetical protein